MQTGDLRHRVTLQQKAKARNTFGEEAVSWVTYATVWAQIEPLRGRERLLAEQVNATLSHKITIRDIRPVSVEDKVVFGTRSFAVNAKVRIEERKDKYIELQCSELAK